MMKIVIKQWEQFTDEANKSNWECRTRCWVYFDLISFHSVSSVLSLTAKCLLTKDVHCRYEQDVNASDKEEHQKEECFRHRKLRYWNEIAGNGFLISFFKRLSLGNNWKLLQLVLLLIANIFHHLNKHQQQQQRGRRKELTSGTKRSWRDDKKI